MRKKTMLALLFFLLLLLAGCGRTPPSPQADSTSVVGVLGVEPAAPGAEPDDRGLTVYAGAESRSGEPPALYRGRGETLAAAVERLSSSGDAMVSCSHVEHILLAQTGAGALEEILSYAFQDPRQSTESQLWVARTGDLSRVFRQEGDPAQRMAVLRAAGKDKQGFVPLTLREAAAAVAAGETFLIPALDLTEAGVSFGGYALYRDGRFAAWLTGEAALGAALLKGDPIHWTDNLGDRSVSLRSTGCGVEPQWKGDELTGLALRCELEGVVTGGWAGDAGDTAALEREIAQTMTAALTRMQTVGADAADLQGRAGLGAPLSWWKTARQWQTAFPALETSVTVKITLQQGL